MRLLVLVVVIALIALPNSSRAAWDNYALVTAKPMDVRFVSEVPAVHHDEGVDWFYGSIYLVALTDIEIVHGSLEAANLEVELTATHQEALSGAEKIYLFLDLRGEEPSVMYWDVPRSVACLPKKLVEQKGLERAFGIEDHRTQRVCTNAEWFQ